MALSMAAPRPSIILRLPSLHTAHHFSPRITMSLIPFHGAVYRRELEAAIDVVERACCLCASVQASMIMNGEGKWNKNDHSPVTVADFSVQALVSMELGMLFPSIPLVGEEDAAHLRLELTESRSDNGDHKIPLVKKVVKAVSSVGVPGLGPISDQTVLDAIDRGGEVPGWDITSDKRNSTFWVLDPIDGTRGFLKGGDALCGIMLLV